MAYIPHCPLGHIPHRRRPDVTLKWAQIQKLIDTLLKAQRHCAVASIQDDLRHELDALQYAIKQAEIKEATNAKR